MKPKKTSEERLNELQATCLSLTAQTMALKLTILELTQKLGLTDLRKGVSAEEFYVLNFDRFLDAFLENLEDEDPELAAHFHAKIEAIRKTARGSGEIS